jgi:hypothetical protein
VRGDNSWSLFVRRVGALLIPHFEFWRFEKRAATKKGQSIQRVALAQIFGILLELFILQGDRKLAKLGSPIYGAVHIHCTALPQASTLFGRAL